MAVKAVRVVYKGAVPTGIPYIQSHPEGVIGYPIKIGDPKLASAPVLGAKLSLDKNLPPELLGPIVEYAKTMYPAHDLQNGAVTGTKPLSELFVLEKPTGVHVGGRRKTRKGKGKRSTRKFGGFRNKRTRRR
jgi:hypothetical protein